MKDIQRIIIELSAHPNIVAITLGGSRASGNNDEASDYDIHVYYDETVDKAFRESILQKYCNHLEIGVNYFEEEDDCILKNGIVIELIYRSIYDIQNHIDHLTSQCVASLGYTTCFLDNLTTSRILYEAHDCYSALVSQISYPDALKQNIIQKNLEMLHGVIASYDTQILKAYKRKDMISVNHRIAAYLASYFEVLFAINNVYHPGEKRLLELAKKKCRKLPEHFEQDINDLLELNDLTNTLNNLYDNLKAII